MPCTNIPCPQTHLKKKKGISIKVLACESLFRSVVSDSVIQWTVARQASLSREFSWQEYWSGLPCPSPDLPNPRIKPGSPALQVDSLPSESPGKPLITLRLSSKRREIHFTYLLSAFNINANITNTRVQLLNQSLLFTFYVISSQLICFQKLPSLLPTHLGHVISSQVRVFQPQKPLLPWAVSLNFPLTPSTHFHLGIPLLLFLYMEFSPWLFESYIHLQLNSHVFLTYWILYICNLGP